MKIITKIVCVFLLLQKSLYAQNAELRSLQHVVRWVSEANFPNYTADPEVKDSIFNITTRALKNRFKVQNVTMPAYIDYDYINGFGKQVFINQGSHPPLPILVYLYSPHSQGPQLVFLCSGKWK